MNENLSIRYMPLGKIVGWEDNTKLHDLDALTKSIVRYGFRDAVIYDETLGCMVAGHGRILSLSALKINGKKAPAGIVVKEDDWYVPVQFGINSSTPEEAKAFAIDHNNLVAIGLEYKDIARMYEPNYADIVAKITQEQSVVTVTGEQAKELQRYTDPEIATAPIGESEAVVRSTFPVSIRLLVRSKYKEEAKAELLKVISPSQAKVT